MVRRVSATPEKEQQEREIWNIPNWRTLDGYPVNWDALSSDQKQWEFLRRNKLYRQHWEEWSKNKPSKCSVSGRSYAGKLSFNYRLPHDITPQTSWDELPVNFEFMPESHGRGEIVWPRSPIPFSKDSNVGVDKDDLEKRFELFFHKEAKKPPTDWYDMKVWVEFDLSHSLSKQIQAAEINLEKAQKELKIFMDSIKRERCEYTSDQLEPKVVGTKKTKEPSTPKINFICPFEVVLLRVYDAYNSGVTDKVITDILLREIESGKLPEEGAVRAWRNRAKKISEDPSVFLQNK